MVAVNTAGVGLGIGKSGAIEAGTKFCCSSDARADMERKKAINENADNGAIDKISQRFILYSSYTEYIRDSSSNDPERCIRQDRAEGGDQKQKPGRPSGGKTGREKRYEVGAFFISER
jgi:hypothetical protein